MPAFGQSSQDKKLVPNDSEQAVIARIREMGVKGDSIRAIYAELNAEGIPSKRGGKWHPQTVARMGQYHAPHVQVDNGVVTPVRVSFSKRRFALTRGFASKAAQGTQDARNDLERTWREFERRNPGVEHPGRAQDRIQRQATERADHAPRFTTPTPGELGRANRRAPIRAYQAGPLWDDNDSDDPIMIDGGPFRSRRR